MQRRSFLTLLGGAAAAWPIAARAQQQAMPVIGVLHPSSPDAYAPYVAALRRGLSESGFVEGRNLAIEFRWGEGHNDRLPALAADLVRRQVAVIVAGGNDAALAAKGATASIPIVFSIGADPIQLGLVASLNRPSGNVTGMLQFTLDLTAKRLEMLRELVPKAAVIGVLVDPSGVNANYVLADVEAGARSVGQQIRVLNANSQDGFEGVFTTIRRERIDALLVQSTPLFTSGREQLVALAARYAVPTIYGYREAAAAGGLASYGSSNTDAYRQVGHYVGRILKGDKPADLPVVRPTKFELVINQKTAKLLGITVPPTLLVLADEVIE